MRRIISIFSHVLMFVGLANTGYGQFDDVINVPPDQAPSFIDSNTQLNIFAGGIIDSSFFSGSPDGTSENIEVNLFDGSIDDHMRAYAGSTINVFGGTIAEFLETGRFTQPMDVEVNVSGGSIATGSRPMLVPQ